jgi:hypothetical protein
VVHANLPAEVFVDPYELELYREHYTFEVFRQIGERSANAGRADGVDLEVPVFALGEDEQRGKWGVRVDVINPCSSDGELEVDIPLHLRYGRPRTTESDAVAVVVDIEPPEVYWTCEGAGGHRKGLCLMIFGRGYGVSDIAVFSRESSIAADAEGASASGRRATSERCRGGYSRCDACCVCVDRMEDCWIGC